MKGSLCYRDVKGCELTILNQAAHGFDFEELPQAVDLTDFSVQNNACVEREGPVRIVTPAQQWAYAAIWPIHDVGLANPNAAWLLIRVEATIDEGRIGIAVAKQGLNEFIAPEKQCDASPERQVIEIRVEPPALGMHLVIRNTAENGTVSTALVHRIQAYLAHAQPALAGGPPPGIAAHDDLPPIAAIPVAPLRRGGELDAFETPEAQHLNEARLEHLEGLGLSLEGKSVLDIGCGVGHLSRFFAKRGCRVTCIDTRPENLTRLVELYPGTDVHLANVELNSLAHLGRFDVVFCYGMLYYTENPIAALRNMASCCRETLLLETMVTDHPLPIVQFVNEPNASDRAASDLGCCPTPALVAMALTRMGFEFVYTPGKQPRSPDFRFKWMGNAACQRDGHLLRQVFVASRTALDNPHLLLLHQGPKQIHPGAEFRPVAATNAPEIWLDVGAHLGEKTFAIATQNPNIRVYAFEPNLKVALQSMGRLPNYIMLPMAVSECNGSSPFYVNQCDAASSLLPFVPDGLKQWVGGESLQIETTLTVPTIRLDTFLNHAGISRVTYLKIDAQGADLAVVRSLGQRLCDVERLTLEVQTTPIPLYRDGSSKEDTIRFLAGAGFQLISSKKQSFDQEENLTFARRP